MSAAKKDRLPLKSEVPVAERWVRQGVNLDWEDGKELFSWEGGGKLPDVSRGKRASRN